MHSMYVGTLLQAELLSLSCSRDKLCVVVVHFVQLYPLNPFELAVALLLHSFTMLRRH